MKKRRFFACLALLCLLLCACGAEEPVPYEDDAHEHVYGFWYDATEPTCTQAGSQVRYCKICNHAQEKTQELSDEMAELPHDFVDTVVPPAGNEPGFVSRVCRGCGYTVREPLSD